MGLFKRAFRSSPPLALGTQDAYEKGYFGDVYDFGTDTYMGTRNRNQSLSLVTVYACINLLADAISSLPVDVYTRDFNGVKSELLPNPSWVNKPNPRQSSASFWHQVMVSLLTDGNAFIGTIRNNRAQILECYCLDPTLVEIKELNGSRIRFGYGGETYDDEEITWIPAFTLPGGFRGVSPLELARETIGNGIIMEDYAGSFFTSGTSLTGVIEHPRVPEKDERNALRESFSKRYTGLDNAHKVGILTGGAVFKPISITPEQAQFLETRRFGSVQIATLFRVPAYMVDPQITSTWGSGVEEQNRWFVEQSLIPWLVRIEQAVSNGWLPGRQFFKFDVDARLRPNMKERFDAYRVAVDTGLMFVDEARAKEDMEPLPDGIGAKSYRPLNMGEVTKDLFWPSVLNGTEKRLELDKEQADQAQKNLEEQQKNQEQNPPDANTEDQEADPGNADPNQKQTKDQNDA